MSNILVVGGAGYIGSHCCKLLKQNNYNPIVLDNFSTGYKDFVKWGQLYGGNLGDKELLDKIFTENQIDTVMHFAAFAFVGESVTNPKKYYQNNVVETLTLLNKMIEYNVKNFIFSSTCATYGNPIMDKITEDHPQNPINPYGQSKLMIEKICDDYDVAYGLKSVIFRYFNAAGAHIDGEIGEHHDPEPHLIPRVFDACLDINKTITIYGDDYDTTDGTCVRDYIHVLDICNAHIKAIDWLHREIRSEKFNLGNEVGYSVRDILKKANEVTNCSPKQTIGKRRAGDPAYLVANSVKAKKELSWKTEFSFDEIISSAWRYHKKRGSN